MTVRMQDIATDLKLSKMTISKVLRGQMDVSEKTKQRVLQRAKELNYRPNISARSLRTGRTFNIGLIVPSLAEPLHTAFARSIVHHLRRANYSVFLSTTELDPELERREIEQHLSWQVDALILISMQNPDELVRLVETSQTPLIQVHPDSSLFPSNAVILATEEVGQLAASHLLRIGCRRIANILGPRGVTSDLRMKGFRAALADAGQRLRPEFVIEVKNASREYESGVIAARQLLQARTKPDGIVCCSDMVALGVMAALTEVGIEIPAEIAVIGCGNDAQLCEMQIPLSSVDLSPAEIGEQAAKLALKLLSKEKVAKLRSVTVSPTLAIRASTLRMR